MPAEFLVPVQTYCKKRETGREKCTHTHTYTRARIHVRTHMHTNAERQSEYEGRIVLYQSIVMLGWAGLKSNKTIPCTIVTRTVLQSNDDTTTTNRINAFEKKGKKKLGKKGDQKKLQATKTLQTLVVVMKVDTHLAPLTSTGGISVPEVFF